MNKIAVNNLTICKALTNIISALTSSAIITIGAKPPGTILVAGFLGFAVQNAFKIMKKDPSDINHRTLIQEYSSLKQIFSKIIKEEKAAGK